MCCWGWRRNNEVRRAEGGGRDAEVPGLLRRPASKVLRSVVTWGSSQGSRRRRDCSPKGSRTKSCCVCVLLVRARQGEITLQHRNVPTSKPQCVNYTAGFLFLSALCRSSAGHIPPGPPGLVRLRCDRTHSGHFLVLRIHVLVFPCPTTCTADPGWLIQANIDTGGVGNSCFKPNNLN